MNIIAAKLGKERENAMNAHQRCVERRRLELLGQFVPDWLEPGGDKTRKACDELVRRSFMTKADRDQCTGVNRRRRHPARPKPEIAAIIKAATPKPIQPESSSTLKRFSRFLKATFVAPKRLLRRQFSTAG